MTFAGRRAVAESVLRDRLTLLDSGAVDEFEVEARLGSCWRPSTASEWHAFARVTGALDRAVDPPAIGFTVTEGPKCASRR